MNGFERRRELKKDAILNAAYFLFNQHGFNSITVEKIAETASVSPVSIYNFYKTKENLRLALISKILTDNLECIQEICVNKSSIQEKVEDIFVAKSDLYNSINIDLIISPTESSSDVDRIIQTYNEKTKNLYLT